MATRVSTKEWRKTRLVDACDLNMGQSPDSKTYNNTGEGLPFFQGKTDFGRRHPSVRIYCSDPKKVVDVGDILISVRAPVGPVNIADAKSCIGRGLAGLRSKNEVLDQDFLYFELLLNEKSIASLGSGSTFHAINKSQLADLEFDLPSLPEQKAIARVLTTVQDAIAEQENLIAKLKELKRSMMQHLFTHGTQGEVTKMTEIGEIPESWAIEKLGDICETSSGGTPSRTKKEYYSGHILWVKSGEMNDGYISDSEEKITREAVENSSAKLFESGTLLIAMYGATAGKTAIISREATTNQAVCGIFKNSRVDLEFIRYALILRRGFLLDQRHGGAQPNLSQTSIRNLYIPLPKIEEQEKISNSLIAIEKKIVSTRVKLASYQSLFKTLLHELMSGEVRIKNI